MTSIRNQSSRYSFCFTLIFTISLVLFAIAAGMASMAPAAYADHAEVSIGAVEESGFSQSCVEAGCYTPSVATVDVGGVVTMTNTDPTGVHTFTSGTVDGFTPNPNGLFDSGVLMSGDAFEWSPTEAGTVPYYCMLHTWMIGIILVGDVDIVEPELRTITVQTDSATYDHNDTITVTGQVANVIPGNVPITVTVISPMRYLVTIDQFSVARDGSFETTMSTSGNLWKYDGTYIIEVNYGVLYNNVKFELDGGEKTHHKDAKRIWLDEYNEYFLFEDLRFVDLSGVDFSGADLTGADFTGANLSGADLTGANLSGANMNRADLHYADFSDADLTGADLRFANLSGTNLSGANLSGANLPGTNLSGANLYGANLSGANLRFVDLSGANLSGANLEGTDLEGTDLSGAVLTGADHKKIEPKIDCTIDDTPTYNKKMLKGEKLTIMWFNPDTENCRYNILFYSDKSQLKQNLIYVEKKNFFQKQFGLSGINFFKICPTNVGDCKSEFYPITWEISEEFRPEIESKYQARDGIVLACLGIIVLSAVSIVIMNNRNKNTSKKSAIPSSTASTTTSSSTAVQSEEMTDTDKQIAKNDEETRRIKEEIRRLDEED